MQTSQPLAAQASAGTLRWWQFPTGWLTLGLPALAVVASTLSAVIAVRGADRVIEEHGACAAAPRGQACPPVPSLPAELARNHASLRP